MKPHHPGQRPTFQQRASLPAEPLKGKTFLLTRDPEENAILANRLKALGAEAIDWSSYTYEGIPEGLAELTRRLQAERFDWIVFTSARTVSFFIKAYPADDAGKTLIEGVKVAAVGARTASALREHGIEAHLVPEDKSASGLARSPEFAAGQGLKILLPHAEDGREEFAEAVAGRHEVTAVALYRKRPFSHDAGTVTALSQRRGDWIVFYSPSAVDAFKRSVPEAIGRALFARARFAVIGRTTAQYLSEQGYEPEVVARGGGSPWQARKARKKPKTPPPNDCARPAKRARSPRAAI